MKYMYECPTPGHGGSWVSTPISLSYARFVWATFLVGDLYLSGIWLEV